MSNLSVTTWKLLRHCYLKSNNTAHLDADLLSPLCTLLKRRFELAENPNPWVEGKLQIIRPYAISSV